MYFSGSAVMVCFFASVGVVFAQSAPPQPAEVRAACQDEAYSAYGGTQSKKPDTHNIESDTKAVLAAKWSDSNTVVHALRALGYLTVPTKLNKRGFVEPHPAEALTELESGSSPSDKDLLEAVSKSSGLLDDLAQAQTLFKGTDVTPVCEKAVFASAKQLIDIIYQSAPPTDPKGPGGKQKIVEIDEAFGGSDNHVALYLLLNAYPNPEANTDKLEILRAAFVIDAKRLAKLVSDKIAPAAKQTTASN
jgi:hypothetical protein